MHFGLESRAFVVAALIVTTSLALTMWHDGDAMWWYAATHEPTCTQCQDMAAAAYLRVGDVPRAIERQEQAVRVSATTAFPRWERHWNLAELWLLAGNRVAAQQAFLRYLAAVPPEDRQHPADRGHIEVAKAALLRLP